MTLTSAHVEFHKKLYAYVVLPGDTAGPERLPSTLAIRSREDSSMTEGTGKLGREQCEGD